MKWKKNLLLDSTREEFACPVSCVHSHRDRIWAYGGGGKAWEEAAAMCATDSVYKHIKADNLQKRFSQYQDIVQKELGPGLDGNSSTGQS